MKQRSCIMSAAKCLVWTCNVGGFRSLRLFILRRGCDQWHILLPRRKLRRNRLFVIRNAADGTIGAGTTRASGCLRQLLSESLKLFLKPVTRRVRVDH